MTDHVDLSIDGAVATVSLNNPPLNVFDLNMRDGLIQAFAAIADIPDVRAMILRAEGKHFSAGADLSEFGSAETIMEGRRIRWDRDPWGPLWDSPVPTVAALHGIAVGSGLEMAMLCDIRLAISDTAVGLPETKLGMLPSAGGTQSLTRAIGPHQATPLIATSVTINAEEALRRGVVHDIVQNVDAAAIDLAQRWSAADADVLRSARRALRASGDLFLAAGLAVEKQLAAQLSFGGRT